MKSLEQTKKEIRKALQSIIQEPPSKDNFAFRSFSIPEKMITEEFKSKGFTAIRMHGRECYLFDFIIQEMLEIPNLEYLNKKEIEEKLGILICELTLAGNKYKDKRQLETKIYSFIDDLLKPFVEYEVFVGLSNLSLKTNPVILGDVQLHGMSDELISEMNDGFKWKIPIDDLKTKFKVFAKILENGNNIERVNYRARQRILEKLTLAKISVQDEQFLHNDRIDVKLSELTIFKNNSTHPNYFWNWRRHDQPREIHFGKDEQVSRFEELNQGLTTIERIFAEKIRIALHWIDLAYREENYEIKQIFLCTALESILSSRSDRMKGAILAIRVFVVATHFGGTFLPSDKFYRIYERRSLLVHGSEKYTNAKETYTSLLLETQNTIRFILRICKQYNIKKQNDLFVKLMELPSWSVVVNHLKKFSNETNLKILKEAGIV